MNEMKDNLIASGVDFKMNNAAYYIHSKFINDEIKKDISIGKINTWIRTNTFNVAC